MRRTKEYTVEIENSRDNGKTYLITEMDAESAEWWAFRVLQALMGHNAEIDFNAPLSQMAKQGLAALAKIPAENAKPLLDEMMGCVQMVMPGGKARPMIKNDIEEVGTRVLLRREVLALHTDFFALGAE